MELDFIFSLIVLVMSIVIHEVAHGAVAEQFGDPTARLAGRLTLNPVRHVDPVGSLVVPILTYMSGGVIFGWAKPVPVNPYNMQNRRMGELFTAFAGPASNLVLALVFGLIVRYGAAGGQLSLGFIKLSIIIVVTNLTLAVFNLMPVPPLDGSKILFSLLPPRYNHLIDTIERYSIFLMLIVLIVLWRFVSPLIPYLFALLTGIHF